MEASLRLRAQDYAAHDRWLVNLQDVITSNRLDDLWENQQVGEGSLAAVAAHLLLCPLSPLFQAARPSWASRRLRDPVFLFRVVSYT